jgi:HAD superfamily hydrolase (TIGR01509 family)
VGRVSVRGVLFDFSGTLFRLEINTSWLTDGENGRDDEARAQELMHMLTAPVNPGTHLPAHLIEDWERRDLDADIHRAVYTESLRQAGLTAPGAAEAGYRQMLDPANWAMYPDVREVLQRLRDAGVPVAVVSNIAWDIRTSFDKYGLTDLVSAFVLSYQEGAVKPDAKLFRIACERIGVDPTEALMVGDSAEADGGAAAIGCAVEIVPPLGTEERPDALLAALARHGL